MILFIAIGLSMDSFAVSLTNGLTIKNLNAYRIFIIAFSFAFFQTLMPFLGWLAGCSIEQYIKDFDHWIAFGLLTFIGSKMILEALKHKKYCPKKSLNPVTLIMQSFATSIDALAVGISLGLLNISIVRPLIIIGTTTFVFSVFGILIGKYVSKKMKNSVEIIGGTILIAIGVKILVEHLMMG